MRDEGGWRITRKWKERKTKEWKNYVTKRKNEREK